MTQTPRTFKIVDPHMKGDDVKNWQRELQLQFEAMQIPAPIALDGVYDVATRSYTASLVHALGINALEAMKDGVTPELRTKVRNRILDHDETARFHSTQLVEYRRALRKRYDDSKEVRVHRPVNKILADSWGYHPGVHDGLDVICQPNAVLFAMVKSQVVDVRPSGWWGLGVPSNPDLKAQGDGIIQLEVIESAGPFVKGHHIGYGHAEKAKVYVGQVVEAGAPIGHAGLANAWHIHLMYNTGATTKGIGNLDPRSILDYAVKHG